MRERKHKLNIALILTISLGVIPFYTTAKAADTLTIAANNGTGKIADSGQEQ